MQDWLAHRARATPGREALVNAASGNAWSYATLDETVEEMAGRLHALGVEQDDHVAAVVGNGVEAVCLVHAAMRLGTTLVPLSPEFTPPELRARLDRADADTVVCDGSTEETVEQAAQAADPAFSVLTIDEADWDGATPLSGAAAVEFTPAEWGREDVQLLLFTSGTTGEPKAVQLTIWNLLASAAASAFRLGIDPEDRWLVPLSLHHMGGIAPLLRSTLYGTTAVIRPSFDPGGTVDDLRSYDATCVSLVPTMLRRMLSARGTLPDSLRFVLVGGAPCPEELIDRCRDYSVPVCPTYGMTETASQVATARHREAYEHPGSVGRPLIWTDVTVVDEAGTPVEVGETGELVVTGPTVTPGYYDDHTATGEAMGTHGFHTGDVGYQDEEGRLYVLNRLDDRILTGGENVDPGEVVDALQAHEEISEAAVVGLPDEQWGEQVAALLVPENEEEPPEVEVLESFLRERLAGFKLPRTLGVTDELPRTVSGTVERETVKERLLEGETVHIERTVDSARAAASERSSAGEELLDHDVEAEERETSEEMVADGTDTAAGQEPEAESAPTEAEPDAGDEEQPESKPSEETAGDDAAGGAEADTESARSILDAVGTEDRPDRDAVESIQDLGDVTVDAELEQDAESTGEDGADADDAVGRAALREEPDGEDVEARAIGTAEEWPSDDEGSVERSQSEPDPEPDDEPTGETGEADAEVGDPDTPAESVPEPERKGGSALADDRGDSSVTAEPGAALGTGRSDDEASAGIDPEEAEGDDTADTAAEDEADEARDEEDEAADDA